MEDVAAGSATFLFTDLEGSTKLSRTLGDSFGELLQRHRVLISDVVEREGGAVYGFFGDAASAVCLTPRAAVGAAAAVQHAFAEAEWPDGANVRVRIGIHSGTANAASGEYHGLDVHHTARICAAAYGGQVLLSEAARSGLDALPQGLAIRDLGVHELKDFPQPERLFQLLIARLRNEFPPLRIAAQRATAEASFSKRERGRGLRQALRALSKRQHPPDFASDIVAPTEPRLGTGALDFVPKRWPYRDSPGPKRR